MSNSISIKQPHKQSNDFEQRKWSYILFEIFMSECKQTQGTRCDKYPLGTDIR